MALICIPTRSCKEECLFKVCHSSEVFGSRAIPGLYSPTSDVDILLTTTPGSEMSTVAKLLSDSDEKAFSHVKQIPAALVPIVTCVHEPSGLQCDLSFAENAPSLTNSRTLAACCKQAWFAPDFLLAVRRRAVANKIVTRACQDFYMNRFAWDLMSLRFLQDVGFVGSVTITSGAVTVEAPRKYVPDTLDLGWLLRRFMRDLALPKDGQILALHKVEKAQTAGFCMPSMWSLLDPGNNRNMVRKLTRFDQEKIRVCAIQSVLGYKLTFS